MRTNLVAPRGGIPKVEVWLDEEALGLTAWVAMAALESGDPPVFVSQGLAQRGGLLVNLSTLSDGEERIVAARIAAVVSGAE